jgi:thioredoxin 1
MISLAFCVDYNTLAWNINKRRRKKMALEHANDTTIDTLIGNGITLVDFWATWCGPCRMFGPIFEATSNKHPDVTFIKFEIDEANRRTPAKYGIRSIPSVLAFKNGELVEARTGLMDEETLTDWINELKGVQ